MSRASRSSLTCWTAMVTEALLATLRLRMVTPLNGATPEMSRLVLTAWNRCDQRRRGFFPDAGWGPVASATGRLVIARGFRSLKETDRFPCVGGIRRARQGGRAQAWAGRAGGHGCDRRASMLGSYTFIIVAASVFVYGEGVTRRAALLGDRSRPDLAQRVCTRPMGQGAREKRPHAPVTCAMCVCWSAPARSEC